MKGFTLISKFMAVKFFLFLVAIYFSLQGGNHDLLTGSMVYFFSVVSFFLAQIFLLFFYRKSFSKKLLEFFLRLFGAILFYFLLVVFVLVLSLFFSFFGYWLLLDAARDSALFVVEIFWVYLLLDLSFLAGKWLIRSGVFGERSVDG